MREWYLVAVTAAVFVSGCGSEAEQQSENVIVSPEPAANKAEPRPDNSSAPAPEKAEIPEEEVEEASLTGPQGNAVRSAQQYLSISGFSREGLIVQLSSDAGDGYAVSDATTAVDSLSVDWNENAAKSARQYLSISGFSCKGLIEQLSSDAGDKYTVAQASYGAREAGAC